LDRDNWKKSSQCSGASSCKVEKMQISSHHTCTFEIFIWEKLLESEKQGSNKEPLVDNMVFSQICGLGLLYFMDIPVFGWHLC